MAGVLIKKFEDRYMLSNIKSERHRKLFETALQYHRELKDLKKPYFSKKRRELQDIVKQIEDNIEQMYHLASILNLIFDEDSLLQRDKKSLPQQIAKVKIKIGRTSNEAKLKDLNRELHLLGQRQEMLEQTELNLKREETKFEPLFLSVESLYLDNIT